NVPPVPSMNRQRVERDGDAPFILQIPGDSQALANQSGCRCVVGLLSCQDASSKQRSGSHVGWSRRCFELEYLRQSIPTLREVFATLPKTKKRGPHAQTP